MHTHVFVSTPHFKLDHVVYMQSPAAYQIVKSSELIGMQFLGKAVT